MRLGGKAARPSNDVLSCSTMALSLYERPLRTPQLLEVGFSELCVCTGSSCLLLLLLPQPPRAPSFGIMSA